MAFDTTYDHLLRLLANRSLAWLRDQIKALPDPLSRHDPALYPLAMTARLAPVLSGLRGMASPLEEIVAHRLDTALVGHVARRVWSPDADPDLLTPLLLGMRIAGEAQPIWQLALRQLTACPPHDLAERLALTEAPDPGLIAEIEAVLTRPFILAQPDRDHIDLFYRLVTGLYAFSATRPRYLRPQVFGQAFENCMIFSEWAVRAKDLTAIAQMITCLRLIDPDHDISELLSEVISCQRPDGSFPARCGWSEQVQDFATGTTPTLTVVAALHLVIHGRWRMAPPAPLPRQPFHACRNQMAARLLLDLPQLRALPRARRLRAAASISRATGCDGFSMMGLQGYAPSPGQTRQLARHLAGFSEAVGHAQRILALDSKDLTCDVTAQAHEADFISFCEAALLRGRMLPGPDAGLQATFIAQREYRAFLARPAAPLPEVLTRLDRLSLLARMFEAGADLAIAA